MSSWEQRMSERAKLRESAEPDRLGIFMAETWANLPPEQRNPNPPDDDVCRECCEWRRYPPIQEHFGYTWWRTCEEFCGHECHDGQIWLA